MSETKKRTVPFCTCTDTKCPFHPTNHDKGCTPCIAKNLKEREIPTCFFKAAGGEKPTANWHYEDFAALITVLNAKKD
ncbi:MAG: hypothetical protein II186_09040 [Erysipelotrichales bacterium]|nr:hypothetical protein [Erysipelotrichales bacterium]MBQ4011016.1 hypothetical protein [Erysipelotrichales bacterium]